MHIGVITNVRSRWNRNHPQVLGSLRQILGGRGVLAATEDPSELPAVAQSFRDAGVEILALNGGDGTNHVTLTAFLREWGDAPLPAIAFLRGGTMNTVARGCGVTSGRPETLLQRLVQGVGSGGELPFLHRHLLRVNEHYGFIFGNGLIANYLRYYYEGGDASPIKAAKVLAQAVGSVLVGGEMSKDLFAPVPCRVTLDGVPWPKESFAAIGVGTVPEVGLGFTPFFHVLNQEGVFHALGIACSPMAFVADMPKVFQGKPTLSEDILSMAGKKMVIHQQEGQSFMIDGDVYAGGEVVEVEVGPRVRVFQG